MAKKTLIALAAPLFASYHKVNTFHFTSDNCPFFDEYSAKNHAATLADKTITPVTRDEAIETVGLTDEEAEATFNQLLADNRKEFAGLFGFDAADHLSWQELDAAIFCHKQFVDQLKTAYLATNPEGPGSQFFKIVAVPVFDQVYTFTNGQITQGNEVTKVLLHSEDHASKQIEAFIKTDNQPAPTNNDVASDAAGTVQEQAPAAKAAIEEKPATVKKPKAPKAKPAVEPVAAEQAEKPAGEQQVQPAAEQPAEPAADQQTENN